MVKTYCFDIDGTICSNTDGDYENAKPFSSRIELVNKLFHEGHNIVYFTARGSTTGIDWKDFTKNQLKSWGALHHKLILNKPFADYYIDDKSHDPFGWFNQSG